MTFCRRREYILSKLESVKLLRPVLTKSTWSQIKKLNGHLQVISFYRFFFFLIYFSSWLETAICFIPLWIRYIVWCADVANMSFILHLPSWIDLLPLLFLYKQILLQWNVTLKTPNIKKYLKYPIIFFALFLITPDFVIIPKF